MDVLQEFNHYRSYLFSVAYRMLGSVMDAEDILQEAFLSWEKAANNSIRSPKAYLATIVTRLCINQLKSARVQREQYVGPWLPEPLLTETDKGPEEIIDKADSLSFAFLMLLEKLTPVERAIFLLREVFDYNYAEIAEIVDKNEANCRQLFRRAQQHIREARPRFETSVTKREQMLKQFLSVCAGGNIDELVGLLAEDVTLYADGGGLRRGAALKPVFGNDRVARFLLGVIAKRVPKEAIIEIRSINGYPGIAKYLNGKLDATISLDIVDGRIQSIYTLVNPEKLKLVDLNIMN